MFHTGLVYICSYEGDMGWRYLVLSVRNSQVVLAHVFKDILNGTLQKLQNIFLRRAFAEIEETTSDFCSLQQANLF